MSNLTKQEWLVLAIVAVLLAVGWAVKTYRQAHLPPTVAQPAKSL